MKQIFRNIRKFISRSWRTFAGDLRDLWQYLVEAYEYLYLIVFLLVFGFASGFWLAAMIAGFLIIGYLCWIDFRPPRYTAATAFFLIGIGLVLLLPIEKDSPQRLKIGHEGTVVTDTTTAEPPVIVFP